MTTKSYTELRHIAGFEDRYDYLKLKGAVGAVTFGFDRYISQNFYSSREWKLTRNEVILRDNGCDLGIDGFEIHDKIIIHHMNPINPRDLTGGYELILSPEFLISVTMRTHNAIHYGDSNQLRLLKPDRRLNDTKLW